MTSVTLPRRALNLHSTHEYRYYHSCNTDDEETNNSNNRKHRYSNHTSKFNKSFQALSFDEPEREPSLASSPTATNNNRLKHLCSRFKRRFVLTKQHRSHSEDVHESTSERRMARFGNYESFSSSVDDPSNEFIWPDFEKVYDNIPPCLINALPGMDDFSITDKSNPSLHPSNLPTDQTDEDSNEQMDLFTQCQRGTTFRRNAICHKLDKSQYNGQLDTFVQQLMVEKLMRTWT